MLNRIKIERATQGNWDLDMALMSHTPGTREAASEMSSSVKSIRDRLYADILVAFGVKTEEEIKEAQEREDGVMRYVE